MVRTRMSDEPSRERRVEVLLEQIRSEVQVVGEGHSLLARELREHRLASEQRFEFLERAMLDGFREMNKGLAAVNQRLDHTNQRLDHTNQQLGEFVTRFDTHDRAHTT